MNITNYITGVTANIINETTPKSIPASVVGNAFVDLANLTKAAVELKFDSSGITSYSTKTDLSQSLMQRWVKNKATSYTDSEITLLSAIKSFNIVVPTGTESDNWIIQYVSNVPLIQSAATFSYTIQLKNNTSGKFYKIVFGGVGYVPTTEGYNFYDGTSLDTAGTGTKVDFYVAFDWSALPTNFEYTGTNLVVNPGTLNDSKDLLSRLNVNSTSIATINANALPNYIKNRTFAYSTAEAMAITAIKEFDVVVPTGTESNNWTIQILANNPPTIGTGFTYSLQIRNSTTGKFYKPIAGGIGYVVSPQGYNIYSGTAVDTAGTGTAIDYYIVINWNALSANFEVQSTNILFNPGKISRAKDLLEKVNANTASLASLNTLKSPYLKNQTFAYSATELMAISAIKDLDIIVPAGTESNNWMIHVLANNPTVLSPASYSFTLQIRNTTTGKFYQPVKGGSGYTISAQGYNFYRGTAVDTAGTGTAIDYYVTINWNALSANFEVQTTNILINPGKISRAKDLLEIINSGSTAASYLKGKTVLYLGTSIPTSGYPDLACTALGATCINNAVGSSMVRRAAKSGSYSGLPYTLVWRSLSHTLAEKQDIIDNWDTYKTQLTGTPPSGLTSTDIANIRGWSYESLLLPYLNGTHPFPDFICFDHGYNDMNFFQTGSGITLDTDSDWNTQPSTRTDRNTFIGGMNYLLDLIFSYNPKQRVAIIGHYENQQYPRVASGQTFVANQWQFPFLKTWEKTGFSQQIIVGSKSLYASLPYSTYVANFNTSLDMTAKHVWLPDDLHPFTDTTGKATALYANILQGFLSTLA